MIDIRELRIGNIVNDDTNLAQDIGCKVVGIVESISEENIGLKYLRSDGDTFYGEEHPINLSPIPLTEELLLKCGFEKHKWGILTFYNPLIELDCNFCLKGVDYNIHIQSLHQLQNIYFDLTGKELMVNL